MLHGMVQPYTIVQRAWKRTTHLIVLQVTIVRLCLRGSSATKECHLWQTTNVYELNGETQKMFSINNVPLKIVIAVASHVCKRCKNTNSILQLALIKFPLADTRVEVCWYWAFTLCTALQTQQMFFWEETCHCWGSEERRGLWVHSRCTYPGLT